MQRKGALSLALLAALAAGCENKSSPPPAASAQPAATTTTTAALPSPSGSASAKALMANCPNTVEGATTAVSDVEGGVELTVTAKDDAAAKDIRVRAKHLAEVSKEPSPSVRHNQSGAGGGKFGRCPVVVRETQVDVAEIEGGAKITVKPKDAGEVDWLRREARERQADLGEPGGKDAGKRKMAHCPSAVTGATTAVKDAADGVVVTITAGDEAATKEIRERAAHVLDAVRRHTLDAVRKNQPPKEHDGDGKGGGGLGRCPIVVENTKVEAKDVPGGSELTVKPEKPADIAALRKETRDRAQNFSRGAAAPSASASAAPAPAKK